MAIHLFDAFKNTLDVSSTFHRVKQLWNRPPQSLRLALLGTTFFTSCAAVAELKNEGLLNDIVFVPIVEEMIYKGLFSQVADTALNIILGKSKDLGEATARVTMRINAIAGVFGLTHDFGMATKFWFLGRATGYLKEKTGSYVYPIAIHMLHNALAEAEQYLLDHQKIPVPLCLALDCLVLWKLGKNINPLSSLKETYDSYFNRNVQTKQLTRKK